MKKQLALVLMAGIAVACTSRDVGPYAPTAEDRQNEVLAAKNAMCTFENQERCAHVIENRNLMTRFFAPETLGGMNESEKFRGRRITTKFIVEAAATIKQCRPVVADSVVILRDVKINGGTYLMKATKPASENSACFIIPDPEAS
ncbi:MAG: hypothetical protein ACR2O3_00225 [Rhizobiaceae bacterium]